MSKKISIAFVLLLILAIGFWQLPWICATLGMKLPQSLAFLNDIQLSSPKPKEGMAAAGTPSSSDPASTSDNAVAAVKPSLSTPTEPSAPSTFAQGTNSETESQQVVNKQPILGDVAFNAASNNDIRLSSPPAPGSIGTTQAPIQPAIQPLATLAQRTTDGSRVTGCLVSAMDIYGEVKVPAQEPGVILELTKTAGMMIQKGESIGKIDDSQPKVALRAAEAEIKAKKLQAESKDRYIFSVLATQVSQAKLEKLLEANKTAQNSVSQIEIEETRLMVRKSEVEGKLALEEMQVAAFAVATKEAEKDAQVEAIERRQLRSPVSGVIREVVPHIGEWVKPGDVVFHVINMDRLQVSGTYDLLNDQKIGRPELMNREVIFEFEYKKGEIKRVPAKIVYVDPSSEYASSLVKVKAEIVNTYDQTTKDWLVHPNNIGDLILFSK